MELQQLSLDHPHLLHFKQLVVDMVVFLVVVVILADLVVEEDPLHLVVSVVLELQDKEILVVQVVLHQPQRKQLQAAVVVLAELGELEILVDLVVQVVLVCQHFKEILEFPYLMELLDQHQEDILLAAEAVEQTLQLLALVVMVVVEKDRQDLLLEL
jgi:hypothetical protein